MRLSRVSVETRFDRELVYHRRWWHFLVWAVFLITTLLMDSTVWRGTYLYYLAIPAACCFALAALLYGVIGSPKLLLLLRLMNRVPNVNNLARVITALQYPITRRTAANVLVDLLPMTCREEAARIDWKLWRNVYKYMLSGSDPQKRTAIQAVELTHDLKAIPFLDQAVRDERTSADLRADIRNCIAKLQNNQ